ncbi:aminotransferase class I/II-fold pyridoxal phosphate-dependent enzyme [Aquisalimonas lutea]|uniref:trans-sulfuration enzyme family protein n=1 Tax=Aquisalimonas lutea TaxID=1327750 RepID=UPI0025B2AE02|nr:aminotransferase class I/II-fold pyridoxal phosphate-dependent enzyme [Aquisalimonas lutea]MDN3519257.1 aminotransferase class I/II-fold pyridoxal phosphate-dependent enzyme [Aquisalimonas lutea]
MAEGHRFATHCVHAGALRDSHGAARPPIYNTTTFAFPTTSDLRSAESNPHDTALYTRYGSNPTLFAVEKQLAALEGAQAALVFGAGMAAISAACLALGRGGIVCLGNAYGGTLGLLSDQLPQLGIATRLLRPDQGDQLDALLADGYGLVIAESPTNPELSIQDLHALTAQAHRHGARLMVDNTFATPVNQRPLDLGADLVVHSATKYLGGHSDLTAGAAMGSSAVIDEVDVWRRQLGQTPAPETAALLGRSLATLHVRVREQNATALRIAEAMADHPAVERVHYPGLPSSPDHAVAARQMTGFGGMLTLDVHGSLETATRVVDGLGLFLNAPSLGGVESLATQPALTSHAGLDRGERHRRGIPDTQIRLSIGLEDAEDLIDDLVQALEGRAADRRV